MRSVKRVWCRAFGCGGGQCPRCGAGTYDHDFVEYGWSWPLERWWRRVPSLRCAECRKWLLFRKRVWTYYCSAECLDKSIPF